MSNYKSKYTGTQVDGLLDRIPGAESTAQEAHQIAQGAADALPGKADDISVVHLEGTETITGDKTFSGYISVPEPTGDTAAANKGYVDGKITSLDGRLEDSRVETTQKVTAAVTRVSESLDNLAETTKSVIPDVKVSTYGRMSQLSSKAREGQMNVTVKGNTLKNLVMNGNFANGTTGWGSYGGSTLSAASNVMSITGSAVQRYPYARQATIADCVTGKKVFIKASARVTNSLCSVMAMIINGTSGGTDLSTSISNPVANTWYPIAGVVTLTSAHAGKIAVIAQHVYADAATASGKVMEVKDVICIDMGADTTNPLYNKTVDEMNALAPLYFDGLASVVAGQIKSIGKNRIDFSGTPAMNSIVYAPDSAEAKAFVVTVDKVIRGIAYTGAIYSPNVPYFSFEKSTGTLIYTTKVSAGYGVGVKYKVEPNKTYTVSIKTMAQRKSIIYYSDDGSVISYGTSSTSSYTFTTPSNCAFAIIVFYSETTGTYTLKGIQLEEGLTITTYEPYTETVRSLPSATLRSLPNGIADYVDGDRFVQNTNRRVLNGTESWQVYHSNTNTLSFYLTISDMWSYSSSNHIAAWVGDFNGADLQYDDVEGFMLVAQNLYVSIKRSELPSEDTAGFKAWLSANKINFIYQLATPIITELLPEPLKSSPNGSIIYENVRREIGTYGINAAVSNSAAPIKTMRKLYKVLADGTKIPLSVVTGITIATDKLSFTHTGLTSGDNIEWEYEFDSALSTTPLIEYSYVNDADDFPATNLILDSSLASQLTIGTSITDFAVSSGVATFTGKGFGVDWTKSIQIKANNVNVGDVIYTSVRAKHNGIAGAIYYGNLNNSATKTLTDTYAVYSHRFTASATTHGYGLVAFQDTISGSFANPITLNLTAIFGAGNEPSKEVMDAIMALYPNNWFDGTVNPLISLKDMFNLLAPKVSEGWITPTLLNGNVDAGGTYYNVGHMLDLLGYTNLRGMFKNGNVGSTVFILPVGRRPKKALTFTVVSNNAFGRINIMPDGSVILYAGSSAYTVLDGITFKAEA